MTTSRLREPFAPAARRATVFPLNTARSLRVGRQELAVERVGLLRDWLNGYRAAPFYEHQVLTGTSLWGQEWRCHLWWIGPFHITWGPR